MLSTVSTFRFLAVDFRAVAVPFLGAGRLRPEAGGGLSIALCLESVTGVATGELGAIMSSVGIPEDPPSCMASACVWVESFEG